MTNRFHGRCFSAERPSRNDAGHVLISWRGPTAPFQRAPLHLCRSSAALRSYRGRRPPHHAASVLRPPYKPRFASELPQVRNSPHSRGLQRPFKLSWQRDGRRPLSSPIPPRGRRPNRVRKSSPSDASPARRPAPVVTTSAANKATGPAIPAPRLGSWGRAMCRRHGAAHSGDARRSGSSSTWLRRRPTGGDAAGVRRARQVIEDQAAAGRAGSREDRNPTRRTTPRRSSYRRLPRAGRADRPAGWRMRKS